MKAINRTNRTIGQYGERVAAKYLLDRGYSIIAKNLRLSEEGIRGEIDILCIKDRIMQIVEVKSIVSYETSLEGEDFLPEMNLSKVKIVKLRKLRLVLLNSLTKGEFAGLSDGKSSKSGGSDENLKKSVTLSETPWSEIRIMGLAVRIIKSRPKGQGNLLKPGVNHISSLKIKVFPNLELLSNGW